MEEDKIKKIKACIRMAKNHEINPSIVEVFYFK